jgi:hypothetical protein
MERSLGQIQAHAPVPGLSSGRNMAPFPDIDCTANALLCEQRNEERLQPTVSEKVNLWRLQYGGKTNTDLNEEDCQREGFSQIQTTFTAATLHLP